MTKTLENAKKLLKMGISIIPLRHRGKEPEGSMIGGSWEKYRHELPTEYDIDRWLGSGWQNYGVVAGWKSLAFLDFDDISAFGLWWEWFSLLNKHAEVYPMPYIVKSNRGAHVYISCPTLMANEKRRGVDVKCHGYVVGAGSTHPSGTQYEAMTDFALVDVFSLSTILPDELFPKIAPSPNFLANSGIVDTMSTGDYNLKSDIDYDPYQIAMFGGSVDLITTVKSRVRIESLFPQAIRTSADGRWLAALCPFHPDKNPSFWIDTRRQLCGCQTCGMKPMDAINLFARLHNMNESDAVTAMAKECGVWG